MKHFKNIFLNLFVITSFVLIFALVISTDVFAVDTCVSCHKDEKFRVQDKKLYDYFKKWKGSIHDVAGISCSDCHGGDMSKAEKKEAHAKILPPDNPASPVFYKNVPKTCGKCHENVYKYFTKSKHYKTMEKAGNGPVCVTCHGSVVTNVYYTSIVLSTCVSCHNQQTGNHPEVISKAEQILHRLNVSKGYLRWTSKHFDAINRLTAVSRVDTLYQNIANSWHRFDLENTDRDSEELLKELKTLFNESYKKKRK